MYSEEETELRDLIIQNLENCGFLNKIKAELRAGVFLALEEDGNLKNKIPLFNKKFDDFVANNDGKLILSLVREFLEYFNLHFSLSVFDPEVAVTSQCFSRPELCEQLKLYSEIDGPVISALMKDKTSEAHNNSSALKSTEELQAQAVSNKSLNLSVIESTSNNVHVPPNENDNLKKSQLHINLEKEEHVSNISEKKETISQMSILPKPNSDMINNTSIEKSIIETENTKANKDLFKETKDILSTDHDPFFDEPLPEEKPSFFSFAETFKDKSENKLASGINKDLDDFKKTSLSSLKDLPSLTGNSEWTYSRDHKSTRPSLDSQKSISSSETSNEEIINLDPKNSFQKKDLDIAESNESSEKQNSEESIEEDIEEDFSAGFDDLLQSSLSLGDDITTDQTVSQVSVVEGVDHVEPCK